MNNDKKPAAKGVSGLDNKAQPVKGDGKVRIHRCGGKPRADIMKIRRELRNG